MNMSTCPQSHTNTACFKLVLRLLALGFASRIGLPQAKQIDGGNGGDVSSLRVRMTTPKNGLYLQTLSRCSKLVCSIPDKESLSADESLAGRASNVWRPTWLSFRLSRTCRYCCCSIGRRHI